MNTTRTMDKALLIAARDGGAVIAGKSQHRGRVEEVSALTIKALAALGLVTLAISPDGGIMGRLTDSGSKLAREYGVAPAKPPAVLVLTCLANPKCDGYCGAASGSSCLAR